MESFVPWKGGEFKSKSFMSHPLDFLNRKFKSDSMPFLWKEMEHLTEVVDMFDFLSHFSLLMEIYDILFHCDQSTPIWSEHFLSQPCSEESSVLDILLN